MFFDTKHVPNLDELSFDGQIIEWVEEFKYLGLTITSNMSYHIHINNVANKISRFVGTFYCLSRVLPRVILLKLFPTFVMPHILLHVELWGASPTVHIRKIEVKMNVLLRTILRTRYEGGIPVLGTNEMYRQLGLLKFGNIFKVRIYKFLVSLLYGFYPEFYDLILRPYLTSHNYRTRNIGFRCPLVLCEVERRGLSYQLVKLNNDIPDRFRDLGIKSLKCMVKDFKTFMLTVE